MVKFDLFIDSALVCPIALEQSLVTQYRVSASSCLLRKKNRRQIDAPHATMPRHTAGQ